jgi:hypothetical protein
VSEIRPDRPVPTTEPPGAGAPPHWLEGERIRVYPWLVIGCFMLVMAVWTALSLPSLVDPLGKPVGNDFIAFWSAARLAVEGRPEAAYVLGEIAAMHRVAVPAFHAMVVAWHYPPTYLLLIFPLGLLPYMPAFGVFLAAIIGFWAALIRGMFSDPRARAVAAAFPAGLFNLGNGQNGFLTAGLAGFALLALERRPVIAGVLIGLLSIKPHLAVLFPLALVAERRWQAFAAAAATALGVTALSVAAFGWATMQAFLHDLTTVRGLVDHRLLDWVQIPSVYVFALTLGLPPHLAMAFHAVIAVAAAGCVWLAWRAKAAPCEARYATLTAASLLVSPYVFFYDFTWAGLAIAWLAKLAMRRGFRPGEREFLLVACIVSGLVAPVYYVSGVQLLWLLPLVLTMTALLRAVQPVPASANERAVGDVGRI